MSKVKRNYSDYSLLSFLKPEGAWLDWRHGLRSLRRDPILLLVAVLSLGLGIGTTVILYSLVDSLLLHDVTAKGPRASGQLCSSVLP